MNNIFFMSSILLSVYTDYSVFRNKYSPTLILFWIISIIFPLLSFIKSVKIKQLKKAVFTKKSALTTLIVLIPLISRIANYSLSRIHTDDLITAFFSANHNFLKINFFSGIPSDKAQWVARFPTTFFVLQKMFFLVFSENLLSVKLSVLPYVFIVSLMLFLTVKKIFNKTTAVISVFLYSFFAISIYFETLGLHFISSTAIFMIFFYSALISFRKNKPIYFVFTGVSAGFCFLFYITSYIALPILFLFFLFHFLRERKLLIVKNYLLSVICFLIVLGPFLTYAYKFDNYFTSRINQVSLLTGSWSSNKDKIAKGRNPLPVMKKNFIKSVESLYKNGVGGHGGYTFNHLSFFNWFSFSLFIVGSLIGFILIFQKIEVLFVFVVISTSFSTMILAIPPPAYQRFTLSFPFIAIFLSLPFYLLLSLKKTNKMLRCITAVVLIGIFIYTNQNYFIKSTEKENDNTTLKIASYINHNFPNRNLYIASFPGFAFEKIYYFSPNKNAKSVQTDYHDNFLKKFNKNEKYVYMIIFPDDFNKKFTKLDPRGRIIPFGRDFSLFAN